MMSTYIPVPTADELFSLHFSPLGWVFAGAALLFGLLLLLILLPRLSRVRRRVASDGERARALAEGSDAPEAEGPLPGVSVIVTTSDDGPLLERLLRSLLAQDYPAPFEVVVVDMDDDKPTHDMIARLQKEHSNIHLTFAPQSARSLSRKKLAITLGVKAAGYDALLFTAGNCEVASPLWLRLMASHFARGRQVVVGYSVMRRLRGDEPAPRLRARRRRAYDITRSALRMLNPACLGYPLRADSNNMGFTRSLFMAHKGFSRHFDLIYGDDDVFIREIATRSNAAVELAPEAFVTAWRLNPASEHRREVMARSFTSRFLRRGPRMAWLAASWLWWLWLAANIAAIAVSLPSLILLCGLTAVNTALCLVIGSAWRRTAIALQLRPLRLTVPWLALNYPIYRFGCHLHKDGATNFRYVWQQELKPKA